MISELKYKVLWERENFLFIIFFFNKDHFCHKFNMCPLFPNLIDRRNYLAIKKNLDIPGRFLYKWLHGKKLTKSDLNSSPVNT